MKRIAQLATGCALLLSLNARGQVINGTFDQNTPAVASYNGVWQWTINGSIQWESRWNNDGDTWWVDLTGCGWGNNHWISQDVPTEPGKQYLLSFDLGCWNGQYFTDAGADVYIGGTFVGHFSHEDFTGDKLDWKTFKVCFYADKEYTSIKFVGQGAGTTSTPPWASPINSYVGVIGLDNVSVNKIEGGIVETIRCAPSDLTHDLGGGTASWYFNGQPLASGPDLIHAQQPGTYTLVYKTECGEITDQIELTDCRDTCKIGADFDIKEKYCTGTYHTFTGYSNLNVPLMYNWGFGYSTSPNMMHQFDYPGVYNICMSFYPQPQGGIYSPCPEVTICKTIVVEDCFKPPYDPGDPGSDGTFPDDPGDDQKSLNMQTGYPELVVFPNPSTDKVTITGLADGDAEVVITVYTTAGELIHTQVVPAGTNETVLSLKQFDAGIYLLKVNGTTLSREVKIIRN